LENLEFAGGILISVYIIRRIFFEKDGSYFNKIYDIIPDNLKNILDGRDILTYLICVPIVLILVLLVLRIVTLPLSRYIVQPFSDKLYNVISRSGNFIKRVFGGLWMIPRALVYTLVLAFLINFSMYFIYSPALNDWTDDSRAYQTIYRNIMFPVLNSNVAKKIPVLVSKETSIKFFNGVTLDKAVESNSEIDDMARKIVGKTTDDRKKAYLLYKWISRNIGYDYSKAERIISRLGSVESGSIPAFETRKGICFDYSCLYISMCRAVGLKVRLVTGSGYSGTAWGDHAWNQVYYPGEDRWINLDTTFGSTGVNYFDKRDFEADHANGEVQGEW
jgi:Transglutaminase-like enzymes, putative cysteine proteases